MSLNTLHLYDTAQSVPAVASLLFDKFDCSKIPAAEGGQRRSFAGDLMTSGSFTMMAVGTGA